MVVKFVGVSDGECRGRSSGLGLVLRSFAVTDLVPLTNLKPMPDVTIGAGEPNVSAGAAKVVPAGSVVSNLEP